MPLLSIVGITSTFKTFNTSFAFLSAEKEEDYQWALEAFGSIVEPKLLITDRELALLMNDAIKSVFPNCIHLLCIWHINTNIFTNTMKDKWDSEERFKNFMTSSIIGRSSRISTNLLQNIHKIILPELGFFHRIFFVMLGRQTPPS